MNDCFDNEKSSGSARRCLLVLDRILRHAPVTPGELCERTGLNRTAVHRALTHLRETGWIRPSLNNRHYFVTSKLDMLISESSSLPPEIDKVQEVLRHVTKERDLRCNIAIASGPGRLILIDSTDSQRINSKVDPVWDPLAWATYAGLSEQVFQRHLLAIANDLDNMDHYLRTEHELRQNVALTRAQGYARDTPDRQIALTLSMQGVANGAIGVGLKQARASDEACLLRIAEYVLEKISDPGIPA